MIDDDGEPTTDLSPIDFAPVYSWPRLANIKPWGRFIAWIFLLLMLAFPVIIVLALLGR